MNSELELLFIILALLQERVTARTDIPGMCQFYERNKVTERAVCQSTVTLLSILHRIAEITEEYFGQS